NYALDRNTIVKGVLAGFGEPTSAFIPSDVDTGLNNSYPYDPTKAKQLLAAAGYPNGFTLDVICQGAYLGQLGEPLVQAAAKCLAAVGIKLNITPYSTDPAYAADVFAFKYPVSLLAQLYTDTPTLWGIY